MGTSVIFCRALDILVGRICPEFQKQDRSLTCALLPALDRSLRFTWSVTPANLFVASMADDPLPHILFSYFAKTWYKMAPVYVTCLRNEVQCVHQSGGEGGGSEFIVLNVKNIPCYQTDGKTFALFRSVQHVAPPEVNQWRSTSLTDCEWHK